MVSISFQLAYRLMDILNINEDRFKPACISYQLPFGCRLIRSNLNWSIKYFTKDGLNRLTLDHLFLLSEIY